MVWIYLFAAALIAWGISKDLARRETWMIGFGQIALSKNPKTYWLTIVMRGLIFLAVLLAAWLRASV